MKNERGKKCCSHPKVKDLIKYPLRKATSTYKLLLLFDLILYGGGLIPSVEVAAFHHNGLDSSYDWSICSLPANHSMEAETVFSPILNFTCSYTISESRSHSMEVLTLAAGTRGPPLFYCVKDSWQAHYDQALKTAVRSAL